MNALYSYLTPMTHEQLKLPPEERIRLILMDRFVQHERVAHVIAQCEFLMRKPKSMRPTGLLVSASSGAGKTALARTLLRRYGPTEATPTSAATQPIIYFCMTDAREAREIYARMLAAWGFPHISRLTGDERRRKVLELARISQLLLIIVDEIQDVLLTTPRQQTLALLAVKDIMNSTQVPILAMGTEGSRDSLEADPHLRSRFKHCSLPVWKTDDYLRNFLDAYVSHLPLKRRTDITSVATMKFIISETDGRLCDIIERLQRAAALAVEIGEERITKELFERARFEVPRLDP